MAYLAQGCIQSDWNTTLLCAYDYQVVLFCQCTCCGIQCKESQKYRDDPLCILYIEQEKTYENLHLDFPAIVRKRCVIFDNLHKDAEFLQGDLIGCFVLETSLHDGKAVPSIGKKSKRHIFARPTDSKIMP
ncbi:hypothetical protein J6590_070045 [Homalodisca vitripennis]|nr:hypothetical protein J6590_070045 [Homalodisca vitripennis]